MKTNEKKAILVTGASGFLGSQLIKQILDQTNFQVKAYTSHKKELLNKFDNNMRLKSFDLVDWENNKIPFNEIDILINCAFARNSNGRDLASSLDFTYDFISSAAKSGIGAVVNISSQSVYNQKRELPATEDTDVEPESLYAITKYSTELLTSNICESANVPFTNLRLASLVGQGFDVRLTNRFVKSAIIGQTIKIFGGEQVIAYMDVRDAADGIIALSLVDPHKWRQIYNFGVEGHHKLIEIAKMVKEIASEFISKKVNIEIEEGKDFINLSMDCSNFYEDVLWKPEYNMETIIRDLFN